MDTSLKPAPLYPDSKRPNSFEAGVEFQDYVCETLMKRRGLILQNFTSKQYQYLIGENMQGIEIKLDDRCTDTGRLSIEIRERARNTEHGAWVDSGIMRDDNSWLYVQGNRRMYFAFSKKILREWYKHKKPEVTQKFGTIETFYMPIEDAKRWSDFYLTFDTDAP